MHEAMGSLEANFQSFKLSVLKGIFFSKNAAQHNIVWNKGQCFGIQKNNFRSLMKLILIFISSVILNATDLLNDFLNMCILHMHMCLQRQTEFLVCLVLLTDSTHLHG